MNALQQYRQSQGLTQAQLAYMLKKDLGMPYSAPLISRIERGVVSMPQNVEQYIAFKIAEKPFTNRSDARKADEWTNTPCSEIKSLKSANLRIAYLLLKSASRVRPISRSDLAKELRTSDREARRLVEELRSKGFRIASDSRHYGYWLCKTDEEYKEFRARYASSAYKILKNLSAMDAKTEGQIEWGGGLG